MDYDSVMIVLMESYSDDIVKKLINIINFKTVDDLVRAHFQAYKLKDMYDTLLVMLRFKILHGGHCGLCSKTSNGGDVIDGPCPCAKFEGHKIRLQHLEMFERLRLAAFVLKVCWAC